MSKMNPEWKTKWLNALRSGEYAQGSGVLRDPEDKFCCLGVLTDLVIKDGEGSWQKSPNKHSYGTLTPDGRNADDCYLPDWVMAKTDIDSPYGEVRFSDGGWARLASMNDKGATFEEIANVIEENL